MKEILAEAKTIHELLSNARYGIDYYQREYRWGAKQVHELLDDLAGEFLDDFHEAHERTAVEKYGHYFLGSVIISHKNAQKFVVDGQQRLTTLTLLLIHLHHLIRDGAHPVGESLPLEVLSPKFPNAQAHYSVLSTLLEDLFACAIRLPFAVSAPTGRGVAESLTPPPPLFTLHFLMFEAIAYVDGVEARPVFWESRNRDNGNE